MSNFITEAQSELEHVVWPTPSENKKYMTYTIGVIVVVGVFLSILGYMINNGLSTVRAQFPHDTVVATASDEDAINQEDIDKIVSGIESRRAAVASGSQTTTGTLSSSGAAKDE